MVGNNNQSPNFQNQNNFQNAANPQAYYNNSAPQQNGSSVPPQGVPVQGYNVPPQQGVYPAYAVAQPFAKKKISPLVTVLAVILAALVIISFVGVIALRTSEDEEAKEKFSSYQYGGLYENGTLKFGVIEMDLPNYSAAESNGTTYLWSPDNNSAFSFAHFSFTDLNLENYSNIEEDDFSNDFFDGMGDSLGTSDFSVTDCEKTYIGDYPTIEIESSAVVSYQTYYLDIYMVFPTETDTDEAVMLMAMSFDQSSYASMKTYLDSVRETSDVLTATSENSLDFFDYDQNTGTTV